MASPHLYVRSTDGSDADNGTTWALAKATLAGAAAIDSTTDKRIWLSDNHAESTASAQTVALAGTAADPTWVVAVDDASSPEPPITLATATCTTTGASSWTINGNCYFYGVTINSGSGAVNSNITLGGDSFEQTYDSCVLNIVATGSNANIIIGVAGNALPSRIVWHNTNISLGNAAGGISMVMGSLEWNGGAVGTSPDLTGGLIRPNSAGEYQRAVISGVDLTEVGVTGFLVGKASTARVDVLFRNCKIPAFTTGGLYTGTLLAGDKIELHNCDSSDTNYRLWTATQWGTVISDTSVYNDAGADDGSAQGFSWQMVSTANAEFPHQTLVSPEIVKWNDTVTGTLTATVEIVHDSQGGGTSGALLDRKYG